VPPVNAPKRAAGADADMQSPGSSSAWTEDFNENVGVRSITDLPA
jgi:hypothetical protein